jgi:hypothetical protein
LPLVGDAGPARCSLHRTRNRRRESGGRQSKTFRFFLTVKEDTRHVTPKKPAEDILAKERRIAQIKGKVQKLLKK